MVTNEVIREELNQSKIQCAINQNELKNIKRDVNNLGVKVAEQRKELMDVKIAFARQAVLIGVVQSILTPLVIYLFRAQLFG